MEEKTNRSPPQRVWVRAALRNNNSLSMGIPAEIRRVLNLHQNCTLVVTLVDDHMEVYKMDEIPIAGKARSSYPLAQRKKSWKRAPTEKPPVKGGYRVEQPDPKPS